MSSRIPCLCLVIHTLTASIACAQGLPRFESNLFDQNGRPNHSVENIGSISIPSTSSDAIKKPDEQNILLNFQHPTESVQNNFFDGPIAKIPVSIGTTWMSDSESGLTNYDTSFKFPILGLIGSPPPIVKTGFSFTELYPAPSVGLPRELFEYTIGVSKVFRVNDRWTIRSMLGIGLATDNRNRTSDAWQFRGGLFGIYKWNEQWQWTVGAIALGRDDLPVVPALGAVWQPNDSIRFDLIPPAPKLNFLFSGDGTYQNWIYLGGGFDGTTWGVQNQIDQRDQLTYRDLRLVLGWLAQPKGEPGVPYVRGRKYNIELGYIFSRELEFNQDQSSLGLDDAWMIRLESRY